MKKAIALVLTAVMALATPASVLAEKWDDVIIYEGTYEEPEEYIEAEEPTAEIVEDSSVSEIIIGDETQKIEEELTPEENAEIEIESVPEEIQNQESEEIVIEGTQGQESEAEIIIEGIEEVPSNSYNISTFEVTTLSEVANGTCGDNLTWTLDEDGTLTIDGTGDMNFYLDESKTWYSIPWDAYKDSIISVIINEKVTSVGMSAFKECEKLTNVTISESVKNIEEEAFSQCYSLTNVILPEGLISIGDRAFAGCKSLISITIPLSLTTIGDYAFGSCSSLTDVYYNGTLSDWLKIDIPGSNSDLTGSNIHCDRRGTCGNNLKWEIDDDDTMIISGSGKMTDFSEFIDVPWYVYREQIKTVEIEKGVTSIGSHAFEDCLNLTNIVIPEGVTSIGKYAFLGCESLASITIPKSVTKIGEGAFVSCSSLKSFIIPDGITSISDDTFEDCSSLKSITIPKSVTSIGEEAFELCISLTDVYYGGSKSGWRAITIKSDNNPLVSATIHYGEKDPDISACTVTLSETKYTYDGSAKKPTVTVKYGSTTLKKGTDYTVAYSDNKNIGTATVTVKGKGNYTGTTQKKFSINAKKNTVFTVDGFTYKITNASTNGSGTVCVTGPVKTSVKTVTIPAKVSIGGKSFKVTGIGAKAFKGCTKLQSVTVGKNVTKIGNQAFSGCTRMTKITIKTGVTSIGKKTFYNCKELKKITIKSTKLKSVGENAFKGIKSNAKIKIPSSKLKAYKKLMKGKGQGSKVKITS